MKSFNDRFVIVFNGEIYNHLNLRKEVNEYNDLKKLDSLWKGFSDTETLLVCFEAWGFEQTISKLVGMFSICLLDKVSNTLHIARDRLGEKPLYYGYVNNSFVFASELKSLREFPDFNNEINRNALKKYFTKLLYLYLRYPIGILFSNLWPIFCATNIEEETNALLQYKQNYVLIHPVVHRTHAFLYR